MDGNKRKLAGIPILLAVLVTVFPFLSSYSQPMVPSPAVTPPSSKPPKAVSPPASTTAAPAATAPAVTNTAPAATTTAPKPKSEALEKYCTATEMRILPGGFNESPCFNSNSPEMVLNDGILLSTFPPDCMAHPEAHLNYQFDGDFSIFSHHVTRNDDINDDRLLYIGFVMRNPSNKTVHVKLRAGGSYLSQPDAPFKDMPELCLNDDGRLFAGPGDRSTNDVLRGEKPTFMNDSFSIHPGEDRVFLALPLPVRLLRPALNGRSTLLKFHTSGPVYIASVAKFVHQLENQDPPAPHEWLTLLYNGALCSPRDEAPTAPGSSGKVKYGRVSGVSKGTVWSATLADPRVKAGEYADYLAVPEAGKSYTYPLSTVQGGTFGTKQVQSAQMLVRYPDTAYEAHGNYGSAYSISIPLINPSINQANVQVLFQTALKTDEKSNQTCFYASPPNRAFFRGTIFVDDGSDRHYWHLVQKQGAEGSKLAEFSMNPGAIRNLRIEFLYPPDATPPQELCIRAIPAEKTVETSTK